MSKPYIVVVGTDYSGVAARALHAAFEAARRYAPAELHVVHAVTAMETGGVAMPPFVATGAVVARNLDEQQAELVKILDSELATLPSFRDAHIRVIAHIRMSAPVFAITELAAELEADAIVVGSHGRHGMARWLLGSVAEAVIRQAPCPVLVIPPLPHELPVPAIEPPCPRCVTARQESGGKEVWCEQHREHHGRRHVYHQGDRVAAETNMPLVVR
jgi:nucleotide-binding universal stress UspA family protein